MSTQNSRRRNMTRAQRVQAIEKVLTEAFYVGKPLSMGQIATKMNLARSTYLNRILEDMTLEGKVHATSIPKKTGISNVTVKYTIGQQRAKQIAAAVWQEYTQDLRRPA